MATITLQELNASNSRHRAQFVNSLTGFKSPFLIGTKSKKGITNLGLFSNVFHIGSNPPLIGYIQRPDSVRRDTLNNIKETSFYTLNTITSNYLEKAHLCAGKFSEEISEFSALDLSEEYVDEFFAPSVYESPISMGMKVKEIIPIELNGTYLVIGEVQWVDYPVGAVHSDGFLDHAIAESIASAGLDAYHSVNKIGRLGYPEI